MTRTRGALGALGAAVIACAATCCASGGSVYNAGADSVGADSTGCAEPPVITEEEYLQLDFSAAAEISELNAETMSGHPSWTNEIMRRYQYQLRDEGYVIVPDVFSASVADQLHSMSMHLLRQDTMTGQAFEENPHIVRTFHLLARGLSFQSLLTHPVIEFIPHAFQQKSTLQGFTSYTVSRGANQSGSWHVDGICQARRVRKAFRDAERFPIMNAIVFLDDQDVENGATRLVPNSHRWERDHLSLSQARTGEIFQNETIFHAEGTKGSVLFFNGCVWHAAGSFPSSARCRRPRTTLVIAFAEEELEPGFRGLLPQWVGPPYADKSDERFANTDRWGQPYPCDAVACRYAALS